MFTLPGACQAFGMQLPDIGTQVMFEVVSDTKTGRPRAENVRLAEVGEAQASWPSVPAQAMQQQDAAILSNENFKMGTFVQDNGRFGFIRMADGKDMFVMPAACQAFGGSFPPQGTEVHFQVVLDAKTGRPRAEQVQPAFGQVDAAQPAFGQVDAAQHAFAQVDAAQHEASNLADKSGRTTGTIKWIHSNGKFGFVGMGDNSEDMFIMPAACSAFGGQIPAIGTPISFGVVVDAKTGKVRAEDVEPLDGGAAVGGMHGAPAAMAGRNRSRSPRRTWTKNEFGSSHY
jgi:cold shock CspA family protein